MSTCVMNAFIAVLPACVIIGFVSSIMWGPLSGVGRSNDPQNNWYLRKLKYGSAFKAWFRLFLTFTIVAYVIFVIAQSLKCVY